VARADSTIRVNIIGDARSLEKAAGKSELAVGGIGKAAKIAGGAIVAAFAADAVLDFAQTALSEADRIGDATTRLEAQLGDLSAPLIEAAGGMEKLGQSRQDVLELEARFTDLATAVQLSGEQIAAAALPASEAAAALALLGLGGGDAATVLDLIGKAAGGSDKPLKELGISLSDAEVEARALRDTGKQNADALTDQELAAARLALIMEKLEPRVKAVTDGNADLEQKQSELQARFETLTGKIGTAIEGPLTDFLGWVLSGIDGLGMLGEFMGYVEDQFRSALTPIARVADALRDIIGVIDDVLSGLGDIYRSGGNRFVDEAGRTVVGGRFVPSGTTVVVQGGSPEVVEQAVRKAINHANGTGPLT
jgi:hypothetical protein